MNKAAPELRKFYTHVSCTAEGRTWTILLDEKTLRTPARSILRLPTKALAELLVREWDEQDGVIRPQIMAFTKLANVAYDHMTTAKAATAGELVRIAAGDALCFRVAEPLDLQELQGRKWDGWLDWAADEFGARLGVSTEISMPEIPLTALENMRNMALEMDVFALTALSHSASILGSAILAFALLRGELDAKQAFDLSRIEEQWQIDRWGQDDEAMARAVNLLQSLEASGQFMRAAQTKDTAV